MSERVKSMELARVLKQLGLVHPELSDLLLTFSNDLGDLITLREENARIRKAAEALVQDAHVAWGSNSAGELTVKLNLVDALREALGPREDAAAREEEQKS